MNIEKIFQLQDNIDEIKYQYDVFINDKTADGKEFRRLLKESEALIHQIEEDVWDGLIAKSFFEEARQLRPRRELDFSTRAYDLTTDHEKGLKKTKSGRYDDIGWI
jgi:hypothetical protein